MIDADSATDSGPVTAAAMRVASSMYARIASYWTRVDVAEVQAVVRCSTISRLVHSRVANGRHVRLNNVG